ncbi:MAG: metal ABC transporter substrate-binding protein [Wujia sp.]
MKKLISVFVAVLMVAGLLTGCAEHAQEKEDKLSIVTTIFPVYDWVNQLIQGNENVELTMLVSSGVDLHSFQPTADDIVKVSSCDMFIYVGGESDHWVEDVWKEATNKNMVVINLLEVLGDSVKEEEIVEGMEGEEEDEGEEEEAEYDEHVWLSLKNAKVFCSYIAEQLGKIDTDHKALYEQNATTYIGELDTLDQAYEAAVDAGTYKTLLFGDRFPFRYLVDDYGLSYYAAFVGCSAESEAAFETITFLAKKVDELSLPVILKIENADDKLAQTIKENTKDKNQEILTLNSLQSVTAKDVSQGADYLQIMQDNLEVLKQAMR